MAKKLKTVTAEFTYVIVVDEETENEDDVADDFLQSALSDVCSSEFSLYVTDYTSQNSGYTEKCLPYNGDVNKTIKEYVLEVNKP